MVGKPITANETEEAIRTASIQLFASKGFEATGIRDIARDVGLTPGAIYHYIGSKEDLLVRIMRDGNKELARNARQALGAASDSPAERLAVLVGVHVRTHCDIQLEALVSDYELRSLNDANRRGIIKLRDRYESLWSQVIEEGVERGAFKVSDPHVTRLALLQMCTGVVNWYSEDGPLSKDELVDVFSELCLQAVGAEAGVTAVDGPAAMAVGDGAGPRAARRRSAR